VTGHAELPWPVLRKTLTAFRILLICQDFDICHGFRCRFREIFSKPPDEFLHGGTRFRVLWWANPIGIPRFEGHAMSLVFECLGNRAGSQQKG